MTTLEPTSRQREAIERPADSETLVVAPAGTGKTEVLIARIGKLIRDDALSPGEEILILSFSRAAVGEIARRTRLATDAVAFARAVTFDSFATNLLATVRPDGDWTMAGYDGRIQAATDAIRSDDGMDEVLGQVRHVLVDEIQDLVGVRRELVGAILDRVDGGFTLFGDPAQAIYDWQENEVAGAPSTPIVEWMRERLEFVTIPLDQNYRARSDVTRSVIPLGQHVVDARPEPDEAVSAISGFVRRLPHLAGLDEASVALRNPSVTTAILCRTNGQALAISGELHDRGIDHRLQRRATDRAAAPWLGAILSRATATTIPRRTFERHHADLPERFDPPDPEEAWRLVKRMDRGNPTSLDVGRIAARIRRGELPDELTHSVPSSVVVSTIHRAKGLEFDQVLLVEPRYREDLTDWELVGELRVTYVALTRARRHLFVLEAPDTALLRHRPDVDRWIRVGWKTWQRHGIEVRGGDVHADHPGGSRLGDGEDAPDVQHYLTDHAHPGDPVTLRLLKAAIGGVPRAFYVIELDGQEIGLTSDEFARDLFDILKVNPRWEVHWPPVITGARIEDLDTVAGTGAAGANAGLGPSGIWLRPRITGLATLEWKDTNG